MTDVSWCFSVYMYAYILFIGYAIQAKQCLGLAEIKGCQVRDWIVRK